MYYPKISIAIATYNSARTLNETLASIKKQSYPQKKVEILIIDGGSTDDTKKIARKYPCRILQNKKTELIFAKHIAFLKASGKYLLYLDSDEVLENPNSIELKYSALKKDSRIKAVLPSGYKTPKKSLFINHYINEFGDPFSFFVYRESKGENYLIKDFSNKYERIYENNNYVVFNFLNARSLPLIELWAGGCMIDLQYARRHFPQIKKDPALIALLFYLFNSQNSLIACTKNDNTLHYSSVSLFKYLKKIASRVKNNIFKTDMGRSGFLGRQYFQPFWLRLRKYLFIPYSLSIILPTIDAMHLAFSRKSLLYLIHLPLCIYTTIIIIYYFSLKILDIKPKIKSYGN